MYPGIKETSGWKVRKGASLSYRPLSDQDRQAEGSRKLSLKMALQKIPWTKARLTVTQVSQAWRGSLKQFYQVHKFWFLLLWKTAPKFFCLLWSVTWTLGLASHREVARQEKTVRNLAGMAFAMVWNGRRILRTCCCPSPIISFSYRQLTSLRKS